jgi:hypothetical protein
MSATGISRSPLRAIGLIAIVVFDVVVANIQVAYLILFRRADRLRTRWIAVPLDLTSPEGITVLMATITLTPGTTTQGCLVLVNGAGWTVTDASAHLLKILNNDGTNAATYEIIVVGSQ